MRAAKTLFAARVYIERKEKDMRIFGMSLRDRIRRIDPILFWAAFVLSLISIVTIFGAVDNFGRSKLIMQCAMTAVGIVALFVIANLDYRFLVDRFSLWLFFGSVVLLAITLLFGKSGENMETGNQSWLQIPFIGIAIQPSEFVKIAFLCTFAGPIDAVKNKLNHPLTLLGLLVHAGIIVGLILISGDLGVALVYMVLVIVMLFAAGLHWGYFAGLFGAVAVAFPFLWDYLESYQQDRIVVGFNPSLDPTDKGWQPLLSRQCIENGGLLGVGLNGGGDYERLAASHTDFIFATICEKFGFLGGILVIATLATLTVRVLWIARGASRDYGMYIAVGVAAILIAQTLENVGMCLALLPTVGITLPFLSCGGSSMLATFMLLGMVHSVGAHKPARRY